jgi:hypothetical protein
VRRIEVGAVAPEHLDPLRTGVLDRLGDEVGDVRSRPRVMPTYAEAARGLPCASSFG